YLSPGEDREAELAGLAHVPAGAVGDDAPGGAHGGADAYDPAPRGHIGAACIGDHDDVVGAGPGDRAGEDVGAAVRRTRRGTRPGPRLAATRPEPDGHPEPRHLGPTPLLPHADLARPH